MVRRRKTADGLPRRETRDYVGIICVTDGMFRRLALYRVVYAVRMMKTLHLKPTIWLHKIALGSQKDIRKGRSIVIGRKSEQYALKRAIIA